ncbi:hypothetical protein HOG16_02295 [Candidatus Woesearchaeota archaeon]|nr:hypothetical protein [Candidatus Woesearchaeota archaeon]
MKKKKKRRSIVLIPIIVILIFAIGILYYSYEFDCEEDKSCYNRHLENCKKTKLTVMDEGSTFIYQITGKENNQCRTRVTLVDMPIETDPDTAKLFEGKSMDCKLEKGSTFTTEILPHCTGPLKEAIYELTIQKMYNILAQSLSDILAEF